MPWSDWSLGVANRALGSRPTDVLLAWDEYAWEGYLWPPAASVQFSVAFSYAERHRYMNGVVDG